MQTTIEQESKVIVPNSWTALLSERAGGSPVFMLPSHPLLDEDWAEALSTIPVDLEETAQAAGALRRRRQIKTASDLLRLVLAYSVCDWSLRLVGLWACLQMIGSLSDVAVILLGYARYRTPNLASRK